MTTPIAAKQYLEQHLSEYRGTPYAVYNPHNKPSEELPVIYGFNNGGHCNFLDACLIAEDGTPLGSHCCSDEGYMRADLGIFEGSRPDRHEKFKAHYPDGYRMTFVPWTKVPEHKDLQSAFALMQKNATPQDVQEPSSTSAAS